MIKNTISILFTLILFNFSFAFSTNALEEGMSRESALSIAGRPDRIVYSSTNKDEALFEGWLYFYENNAQYIILDTTNVISYSDVSLLLEGFLGLMESFSTLGQAFEETASNLSGTWDDEWDYEYSDLSSDESGTPDINFDFSEVSNNIEITIIDARMIKTYSDDQVAGIKLKIKNNSDYTLTRLKIVVYFIDKNGQVFFEEDYLAVDENSWNGETSLKPNYSFLYPEGNNYYTVPEMDYTEWDEGNIRVEIIELK